MNSTKKYPELTAAQIAFGMLKCRENASKLLNDATLLAEEGCYARAYTLAHTSCEELAKFFALQLAGKRVIQANPPDWKRFWRRFRSHDSKLAQFSIQLIKLQLDSGVVDQDLIAASEGLFTFGLHPRNASLYVDVGPDGEFCGPGDIDYRIPFPILSVVAIRALHVAMELGESANDIVATLQKLPAASDKATALKVMSTAISRLRDGGVSKEAALAELNKFWKAPKNAGDG
ncbi:AbiV family abortive infection protein [Burkholderia sp. RF2-non_BP3]|uniref:AbiV family abortive infection protein n=1 Tax=Burkholderia sp. RF2-non_BP3 TaxID=1637844 RepID=UPI0009EA3D90|nr:AbiV family abortive infection protein [Burkholderia sp. RF2-non_BP3]